MSTMAMATSVVLGGPRVLHPDPIRSASLEGNFSLGVVKTSVGKGLKVRSEGIRASVDDSTKTDISRDEILRNQAEDVSEQKSVLGATPSSGSPDPQPEKERLPETGSIFAFDGAVPETVNGRLAMVGLVWALLAEATTGLTVFEQLCTPAEGSGLAFYLAVVQLITFASVVPFLNGESTDVRSFGPFKAQAERWNGRLAMLGFMALLITEEFSHAPVFTTWFEIRDFSFGAPV